MGTLPPINNFPMSKDMFDVVPTTYILCPLPWGGGYPKRGFSLTSQNGGVRAPPEIMKNHEKWPKWPKKGPKWAPKCAKNGKKVHFRAKIEKCAIFGCVRGPPGF